MIKLGFLQGDSCPNVFHHPEKCIVSSVHGDDFTTVGAKVDLDWLETQMQRHYELTIQPRTGTRPTGCQRGGNPELYHPLDRDRD